MEHDVILFYEQGGVEIGDVDAKARQLLISVQVKDSEMALSAEDLNSLVGTLESSTKKYFIL